MTNEAIALTYRGDRAPGSAQRLRVVGVQAGGRAEPLEHVVHYSPTGLEWGYPGAGPSDLALSLLADVIGDRTELRSWLKRQAGRRVPESWRLHLAFRGDHVQRFATDAWELSRAEIETWIAAEQAAAMRAAAERAR